jgi:methylthioribulose-1-phosphate dehydratase
MAAIHRRGWCDGTGGNFSCVLQRQPLELLMAPSGVDKGSVAADQLIVVDAAGTVIRGEGRASAETELHLALVETCGAGAVLHTHSQAGTLLSQHYRPGESTARPNEAVTYLTLHDLEMLKGLDGIVSHESRVAIPVLANDQNLQRLRATAEPHLAQAPYGLLVAGHGLYAWGQDLPMARRHLEILEFLLEQHWRQLLLQSLVGQRTEAAPTEVAGRPQLQRRGIRHVLLDIEGTTCPVSFVAGCLFPYAANRLDGFLQAHASDPVVQGLVTDVHTAWREDPDPEAQALRQESQGAVVSYLRWLIEHDRKLTPLKQLQGLIWNQGYREGDLVAPLFADVPAALRRWASAGLQLAVYSSGSVGAQQLLYGHSNAGDLRPLFSRWFDTHIGAKQAATSYAAIARELGALPRDVLFISDAIGECEAAEATGMQVLFSDRDGNPHREPGRFAKIISLEDVELLA